MKTYIVTIFVLLFLDLIGKLFKIYKQDTYRSMKDVFIDAVVTAIFLVWGAFVIGGIGVA